MSISESDQASSLRHVRTLGKAFVTGHGALRKRFMVRGVALSTAGVAALRMDDILANEHHALFAKLIMPALKSLDVNVIRVYQAHPTYRHDLSMKLLDQHGIYVMVGLATPDHSVKQMTGEYSYGTFLRAAQLLDEFQGYDNTFCFSVGNEVEFPGQVAANLHSENPSWSDAEVVAAAVKVELLVAQAMKSFSRDIKAYMAARSYRAIPVGCAMQDGPQSAWDADNPDSYQQGLIGTNTIAQYYAAGSQAEQMDYIGLNCYRYLTGASPGYYDRLAGITEAGALPVPFFLTETGAFNAGTNRDWADVSEIYRNQLLSPQLSGQVAFQLLEKGAGFGLYEVTGSGATIALTPRKKPGDGLAALQSQFATAASLAKQVGPAAGTPVAPTTAPSSVPLKGLNPLKITWPALLMPFPPPDTTVTFINASTVPVAVVQLNHSFATLPGRASAKLKVSQALQTYILCPSQGWDTICTVAPSVLKDGSVVKNDVAWGGCCDVS
jgi:hypothetical protein